MPRLASLKSARMTQRAVAAALSRPFHVGVVRARCWPRCRHSNVSVLTARFRAFSSTSDTSAPIVDLPPPMIPAPIIETRGPVMQLDEVKEALGHLAHGRYAAAKSSLWRAHSIVVHVPDARVPLAIDRLLAHVAHCEGDYNAEMGLRLKILSALQDGGIGDMDPMLVTQSLTSTIACAMIQLSQSPSEPVIELFPHWEMFQSMVPNSDVLTLLTLPASQRNESQLLRIKEKIDLIDDDSAAKLLPFPYTSLGEFHLVKGDIYRHLLSTEPSLYQNQYQQAIDILSHPDRPGVVPLQRGGLQCPLSVALLKRGGEGNVSQGLSLVEHCLSLQHPWLPIALYYAALDSHHRGEAIECEGLLRSAITQLQGHLANHSALVTKYNVSPSVMRTMLLHAMLEYSALLSQMEWNGKARTSEGQYWRSEAQKLIDKHTHLEGVVEAREQKRPGLDVWFWLWERFAISQ